MVIYLSFHYHCPFMYVYERSPVRLFSTPWTVARQAPLFMGFPGQESWSALTFPSSGDLLDPEIKSGSPALQADHKRSHQGSPSNTGAFVENSS